MDGEAGVSKRNRWPLVVFAALPLPLYLGLSLYILSIIPVTYSMIGIVDAGPVLFAIPPAYAGALQFGVVRTAFRRGGLNSKAGRRVAMLHVRIVFWLTIGTWLPLSELWLLRAFAGEAYLQFGTVSTQFTGYIALMLLAASAGFVLYRGTRKVVRGFAKPNDAGPRHPELL